MTCTYYLSAKVHRLPSHMATNSDLLRLKLSYCISSLGVLVIILDCCEDFYATSLFHINVQKQNSTSIFVMMILNFQRDILLTYGTILKILCDSTRLMLIMDEEIENFTKYKKFLVQMSNFPRS